MTTTRPANAILPHFLQHRQRNTAIRSVFWSASKREHHNRDGRIFVLPRGGQRRRNSELSWAELQWWPQWELTWGSGRTAKAARQWTHSAAGEASLRELQGTWVCMWSSQVGNVRERGLVAHAIMPECVRRGCGWSARGWMKPWMGGCDSIPHPSLSSCFGKS